MQLPSDDQSDSDRNLCQRWPTLADLSGSQTNQWRAHEPGLLEIRSAPKLAIGQRAFLLRTPEGNILWDCIALLDDATKEIVRGESDRYFAPSLLNDDAGLGSCVRRPRLSARSRSSGRRNGVTLLCGVVERGHSTLLVGMATAVRIVELDWTPEWSEAMENCWLMSHSGNASMLFRDWSANA